MTLIFHVFFTHIKAAKMTLEARAGDCFFMAGSQVLKAQVQEGKDKADMNT